jgi:hypothetical protein
MDKRQTALVIGRGRAVIGIAALAVPGVVNWLWLGRGGSTPQARALVRMVGIRDLALGVGTLTTVKEDTQGPEWLSMGAAADGVDAIVSLLLRDAPRRTKLVGLGAAAGAVVAMKIARDLADERAARERAAEAINAS